MPFLLPATCLAWSVIRAAVKSIVNGITHMRKLGTTHQYHHTIRCTGTLLALSDTSSLLGLAPRGQTAHCMADCHTLSLAQYATRGRLPLPDPTLWLELEYPPGLASGYLWAVCRRNHVDRRDSPGCAREKEARAAQHGSSSAPIKFRTGQPRSAAGVRQPILFPQWRTVYVTARGPGR